MADGDLIARMESALAAGEAHTIPDADLQRALTACVRAYAARAERTGEEIAPFGDGAVNATEAVTAACAMIRAVNLNLFDVALWFGREGGHARR
ncbi:MAG: hypothetical protein ACK4MV_17065 [Beijerinckiaceae bacterium]